MDARTVDRRLTEWAREYGGGRYDYLGFARANILARVAEMGGFIPNSGGRLRSRERTPADEVDAIVRRMERIGLRVTAQVLRCDYFRPGLAMPERLDSLRRKRAGMSETTYYRRLGEGREYVGLWLDALQALPRHP